jgi:hypothetical protein
LDLKILNRNKIYAEKRVLVWNINSKEYLP